MCQRQDIIHKCTVELAEEHAEHYPAGPFHRRDVGVSGAPRGPEIPTFWIPPEADFMQLSLEARNKVGRIHMPGKGLTGNLSACSA